jgi:hypothetical protein
MWRSDMYHLLPVCHVYIEVRIKFSESECLPNFLKFFSFYLDKFVYSGDKLEMESPNFTLQCRYITG